MPLLAFVDLNKNNFWGESSVIKLDVDTDFFLSANRNNEVNAIINIDQSCIFRSVFTVE